MKAIPKFKGGRNLAMKVPPHQFDSTVAFYGDVLGLQKVADKLPAICFEFGSNHLWIDKVPGVSQAELWLEVLSDDTAKASQ